MIHIIAFTNKFLVELSLARIRFFIKLFIQGGSRLSQVIVSLGIKFEAIFKVLN